MPTKTENLELNIYSRDERVLDWLNGTDGNFQRLDDTIGLMLSNIEISSTNLKSCVQLNENYGTRVNIIKDNFINAYNTINNSQYSGGVLVESKIYIFDNGGYYIYDIKTNTFSFYELEYTIPSLEYCKNSYKFYFASRIYFFGYDDDKVYTFNIHDGEFHLVDITLPYKLKQSSFAQNNNYLYCFGSEYQNSKCFIYNLLHNSLEIVTTSPNLYNIPVISDDNEKYIYLLGNTPYKFDTENLTFEQVLIQGINKSDLAYAKMKNFGIIFSGDSKEIYRFNSSTIGLEKIDLELPYNLIGGTAIYYRNNIYLFGGKIDQETANEYFYDYIDY